MGACKTLSTIKRNDPYTSFNFQIELFDDDQLIVVNCSEVTGLEPNTEFEEYREGGRNDFSHKLPTLTKYPNLVLKQGMTESMVLFNWYNDVIRGKIKLKSISIVLLDSQKKEVKKWTFRNAFPIKWSGGSLNSTSNSLAFETLEFVHQGLSI